MKVYIVFKTEGKEILGVEAVFSTKQMAREYLLKTYPNLSVFSNDVLNSEIHEAIVQ
jgi:hypothetical protein